MKNLNATYPAALALGAFALGGCATTHVGDDWQCPLTQGSPCLSVADADPATGVERTSLAPTGAGAGAGPIGAQAHRSAEATRLTDANRFAGRSPSAGRRPSPAYRSGGNPSQSDAAGTGDGSEGGPVSCSAWCRPFAWLWRRGGDEATADDANPGGETAAEAEGERAVAPPAALEDMRTPELVGRIWIAPYVDANGVYREGSWVRVVLEPARWRLP